MRPSPEPLPSDILSPRFLKRLDALDFVAHKVVAGELIGRHRSSSRRTGGTLFREHRPLTPGDDLRYVDWNVYARLRQPMVKEFESEEDLDVSLFIDTSASMAYGSPEKFSYVRAVAAAFSFIALRRLESLRIAPCGSAQSPRVFRGGSEVRRAFEFLSLLRPGPGPAPLRSAVSVAGRLKARGIAIVLSDFYDIAEAESMLSLLVHRRFRTFALHVVAGDEIRPRISGRVRLKDAETGRARLMEVDAAILRAYSEAFGRHSDRVQSSCRRREVGYARLETHEPFESALLRLLRRGDLLQ